MVEGSWAKRRRRLARGVCGESQAVQFRAQATRGEELCMSARLEQAAAVGDKDTIHLANRRQTMGDDQSRAVREYLLNACLDQRLRLAIRAGSRLV